MCRSTDKVCDQTLSADAVASKKGYSRSIVIGSILMKRTFDAVVDWNVRVDRTRRLQQQSFPWRRITSGILYASSVGGSAGKRRPSNIIAMPAQPVERNTALNLSAHVSKWEVSRGLLWSDELLC
jgi:hypothetical protein